MALPVKRVILNLVFFLVIWFAVAQLNFFVAWLSISIPAYWVFVFFPVMTLDWREGLVVTLVCGLFLESQYEGFRGILLPLLMGVFVFLHYRRSQLNDSNYSTLLWLASLSHLIVTSGMSAVLLIRGEQALSYLLLRTLQDWFTGQLALFVLFPAFWFGALVLNSDGRFQNGYGEVG